MSKSTYLFSGADPTARDEVLAPNSREVTAQADEQASASDSQPPTRFARTTSRVALSLVFVACLASEDIVVAGDVNAIGPVPMPLEERAPDDGAALREQVASELLEAGLTPDRIVQDPEGGFAAYLFSEQQMDGGAHTRFARFSRTEEGQAVCVFVDRLANSQDILEPSDPEQVAQALARIRAFLA